MQNLSSRIITFVLFLLIGCGGTGSQETEQPISACHTLISGDRPSITNQANALPVKLSFQLVTTHSHRRGAFSQGLIYQDGNIYESTGRYGQSTLSKIILKSGTVLEQFELDTQLFGEGIAIANDSLFQLTWKSGKVLIYDTDPLVLREIKNIQGEAWGLTYDGNALILSDGTSQLRWLDPATLSIVKTKTVQVGMRPLNRLNELEWISGCIVANVWRSSEIVLIDAESGQVEFTLDLSSLATQEVRRNKEHVANGIAVIPETGHLLVTGKNWQHIFELKLI